MSMRTQAMIDEIINKLSKAARGDMGYSTVNEILKVIEDLKALKREDMKREN